MKYLQPGKLEKISKEEITGMDSLVYWKDLYAAEFEMGALPNSLERIISKLDNYIFIERKDKDVKQNSLIVFCEKSKAEDVNHEIDEIINGKIRFKNLNCMIVENHMKGTLSELNDLDFFWDIRNDYFFFFGIEYKEKIIIALNCLKNKWKKPETNFVSLFKNLLKKKS